MQLLPFAEGCLSQVVLGERKKAPPRNKVTTEKMREATRRSHFNLVSKESYSQILHRGCSEVSPLLRQAKSDFGDGEIMRPKFLSLAAFTRLSTRITLSVPVGDGVNGQPIER